MIFKNFKIKFSPNFILKFLTNISETSKFMMALFRIQVCVLLLTILLCLIQYISSTIILEAIGSLNDKNTTEVSERIFRNVDMIENTVKNTWTIIIHHSKLIKSAFGLLILFYGGEFRNTVIFIQALMITGLPIISKYANTLYQSYKINRDTLRKELPDIIQAEADVADLALAIESDSLLLEQLEAKLASNEISMQEFIQDARPIRAKLKKSKELMQKTQAVQNSIGQLKHSLHIQHLQVNSKSIYNNTS